MNRLESIIHDLDNFSSKKQGKARELLYKRFREGLQNDATIPELKEILRIIDPALRETDTKLTANEIELARRTAVLFNEYVHHYSSEAISTTLINEVRERLTDLILGLLLSPSAEDFLTSLKSVWAMLLDCDAAVDTAAKEIALCLPVYLKLIKDDKLKLYKYTDALIDFEHQAFQMPLLLASIRLLVL